MIHLLKKLNYYFEISFSIFFFFIHKIIISNDMSMFLNIPYYIFLELSVIGFNIQ